MVEAFIDDVDKRVISYQDIYTLSLHGLAPPNCTEVLLIFRRR